MKNDHAMVIRADAKAMGAVTAHETRVSKRWQASKPEQREIKWGTRGHCISYRRDEHGEAYDVKLFKRSVDKRTPTRQRSVNKADEIRARLLNIAGNNSDAD